MDVSIDEGSAIPVYRQLVQQVVKAVGDGSLRPGDPLPTIRQLAGDLDVTPATVSKVYQILEGAGIIATAGRRGTFVHGAAVANAGRFLSREMEIRFREFVDEQLQAGIAFADLKRFVHKELSDSNRRNP